MTWSKFDDDARRFCGVYFIQAGHDRGPVKIGYASHLPSRLRELQVGNAERLYLLGMVQADAKVAPRIERRVHERFSASRIRGEWFSPTLELFQFIEGCSLNVLTYDAEQYGRMLADHSYRPSGHRFDPDALEQERLVLQ